jgi:two-component system NtrC family response regulator
MNDRRRPLLIVEDDPALQTQMKWAVEGFDVDVAADRAGALAQVRRLQPAVVTLDLGLPPKPDTPEEGMAALAQILEAAPDTKVIVVTGQHDRANALRAVELGAYDFFEKPFDPETLALAIARAFRLHELQEENRRLRAMQQPTALGGLVTRDPEMLRICRSIEKLAPAGATVLLLGDSGTGKELLARALHEMSPRRGERFVAINCAAIPETLLESELFGYEKGAFTGAARQTPGKIEVAQKGTLFLDEIGDLPLALQAKLLRFLQERTVERLGGRTPIEVDVRVVCATHQDLKVRMAEGRFREDLYYRVAEILVRIPRLRDRIGDAVLLAHLFAQRFAEAHGRGSLALSADAVAAIEAADWPGNVRQLENVIKRAVIMADGPVIRAVDLELEAGGEPALPTLKDVREQAERRALLLALARADNNMSRAAEILGISRPTLYDLMHRFGMK